MRWRMFFIAIFIVFTAVITPEVFAADLNIVQNVAPTNDLEQQIKSKQDAIKQIEAQIDNYKRNIAEKQKETLSLKNQLSILDSQISKAELDLQLVVQQIAQLELEIKVLANDIGIKNNTLLRQQNLLAGLVRALHEEDSKSYIDIILSEQSFSKFFNQLFYLGELNNQLDKTLQSIQKARDDVQIEHDVTARKRELLKDLQKSLEQKRAAFDDKKKSKELLLRDTKSSEIKFKSLLAQLRSEYTRTDQEVAELTRALRQKLLTRGDVEGGVLVLSWPLASNNGISTHFHDPSYPFKYLFEHSGLDLRIPSGTPVISSAPGYIAWVRTSRLYGNNIMIVHRENISTLYAHLSRFNVGEGDYVKRGDIIAWSGGVPGTQGAGLSTGAHLHFEVRENGLPVDPLGYLTK